MAPPSESANGDQSEKSYFETQRAVLMEDIGVNFEQVLQNLNKLNRSLEGIIAVGNEFSSVEALWSYFENVMAKPPDDQQDVSNGQEALLTDDASTHHDGHQK